MTDTVTEKATEKATAGDLATTWAGDRIPTSDPRVRRAIDLVWHEATLLDRRQYHDWERLFTSEGRYVVPIDTDTRDFDDKLNMIYDDAQMRSMRVVRMTEGYAIAAVDSARTCRTVSRFTVDDASDEAVTLRSSQILVAYKRDHHDIWAAEVEHRIVLGEVPTRDRIQLKVVRLIDADAVVPAAGFLL